MLNEDFLSDDNDDKDDDDDDGGGGEDYEDGEDDDDVDNNNSNYKDNHNKDDHNKNTRYLLQFFLLLFKEKSRIQETKHLSTIADSSTNAIGGWTKAKSAKKKLFFCAAILNHFETKMFKC